MAGTSPCAFRLTVLSDPKLVRVMRGALLQAAGLAGFNEHDAQLLTLAVEEGFTNVIKYGYDGDCTKKINLACRITPGEIEIRIRDFGKKANPEQIRSRKLSEVRPGGLGVHLMQEIMDVVEYDHGKKVGTELKLVKRVKERKAEGAASDQ